MLQKISNISPFGQLLKRWRAVRGISQLSLAHDANISPRHLCFVETGRSQPSRDIVQRLAAALDVPLRERNALLLAAGYAPAYRETDYHAPAMSHYRHVIELLLKGFEPFGAVALDRHWNILEGNRGFWRTINGLGLNVKRDPANLLEILFTEEGLRSRIQNWEEVGYHIIQRLHREAIEGGVESESVKLLQSLLGGGNIPAPWKLLDVEKPPQLVIPLRLDVDGQVLSYVTAITTLGTAQDVTLQELRIEAFLPSDEATEIFMRDLEAIDDDTPPRAIPAAKHKA